MNNYIVGGRSQGKTRKLLEYAKENNAIVICKNPYAMEQKAKAYGIIGLRFIGYDRFAEKYEEQTLEEDEKYVIDEITEFFNRFFHTTCIGFTQTEED